MSVNIVVRVLRPQDMDAIVAIDEEVTGSAKPEYYAHKLQVASLRDAQLNTSLVAEADGKVVGFLMGSLFLGEFGIPESSAMIEALGVSPAYQDRGVGSALLAQFRANMKVAQVEKIYTLVDWKDFGLLKFFGHMGFGPSQRLSLECPVA
ncbi:MAG: GNAT family N-acetyltransferase [Deferrisomatales bacterium]|nr:GNAT family N-acetyltransferase [Deferrisomatales bacterium]